MIELQTIDEAIDDNGLKILVHAPSGFGKTVLCATTGRKSLLINAESGLLSLKEVPEDIKKNIDVVTVNELTELGELYDMLAQGGHPYDWIMLDSLSEIAEVCRLRSQDWAWTVVRSRPAPGATGQGPWPLK
ncbi:hypothetical protein LCGC14_2168750 [marine sediment metagenome]|uniref:AAA domain-containing protein n=1 Tax=marine sediment metagenome TaxID=412755 RepID=A0A0F9GLM7_9ZZZZ